MPDKSKTPPTAAPAAAETTQAVATKKKAAKPAPKQVKIADIKPGKVKMVRGSYALPKQEYALLAKNKERCLKAGVRVKKGELLRAGLLYLSQLPDVELIAAVVKIDDVRVTAEKAPKKNAAVATKTTTSSAAKAKTSKPKAEKSSPAQTKPVKPDTGQS